MGAISQLCSSAILLNNGKMMDYGSTNAIIERYLDGLNKICRIEKIERKEVLDGNYFQYASMCDENLIEKNIYKFNETICIKINFVISEYNDSLELAMRLIDKHKKGVFTIHEKIKKYYSNEKNIKVLITIEKNFLTPGNYSWIMCINHPGVTLYDLQEDILPFTIAETGSEFARYEGADYGSVFAKYTIKKYT
jgi:lipopolysaccharide transport system ATP-binding protein